MNPIPAQPFWATVLAAVCMSFVSGCGGKTAPVDGRVAFADGSDINTLAGYGVAFELESGGASAVGEIQPDGSFTVSTYGANDGALPGRHRVTITPPQSPDPDKPPQKSKLPAKYESFETSGLVAEIKPGRNLVEFKLQRAAP